MTRYGIAAWVMVLLLFVPSCSRSWRNGDRWSREKKIAKLAEYHTKFGEIAVGRPVVVGKQDALKFELGLSAQDLYNGVGTQVAGRLGLFDVRSFSGVAAFQAPDVPIAESSPQMRDELIATATQALLTAAANGGSADAAALASVIKTALTGKTTNAPAETNGDPSADDGDEPANGADPPADGDGDDAADGNGDSAAGPAAQTRSAMALPALPANAAATRTASLADQAAILGALPALTMRQRDRATEAANTFTHIKLLELFSDPGSFGMPEDYEPVLLAGNIAVAPGTVTRKNFLAELSLKLSLTDSSGERLAGGKYIPATITSVFPSTVGQTMDLQSLSARQRDLALQLSAAGYDAAGQALLEQSRLSQSNMRSLNQRVSISSFTRGVTNHFGYRIRGEFWSADPDAITPESIELLQDINVPFVAVAIMPIEKAAKETAKAKVDKEVSRIIDEIINDPARKLGVEEALLKIMSHFRHGRRFAPDESLIRAQELYADHMHGPIVDVFSTAETKKNEQIDKLIANLNKQAAEDNDKLATLRGRLKSAKDTQIGLEEEYRKSLDQFPEPASRSSLHMTWMQLNKATRNYKNVQSKTQTLDKRIEDAEENTARLRAIKVNLPEQRFLAHAVAKQRLARTMARLFETNVSYWFETQGQLGVVDNLRLRALLETDLRSAINKNLNDVLQIFFVDVSDTKKFDRSGVYLRMDVETRWVPANETAAKAVALRHTELQPIEGLYRAQVADSLWEGTSAQVDTLLELESRGHFLHHETQWSRTAPDAIFSSALSGYKYILPWPAKPEKEAPSPPLLREVYPTKVPSDRSSVVVVVGERFGKTPAFTFAGVQGTVIKTYAKGTVALVSVNPVGITPLTTTDGPVVVVTEGGRHVADDRISFEPPYRGKEQKTTITKDGTPAITFTEELGGVKKELFERSELERLIDDLLKELRSKDSDGPGS